MRLVYEKTGKEVQVGDEVTLRDGEQVVVKHFREPHKPSSQGKVLVCEVSNGQLGTREYYVSVIGAEWIEREDRDRSALPASVLVKKQVKTKTRRMHDGGKIQVNLRYDDQCGNGHNSFSITGYTWDKHGCDDSGGCIHEEIAKYFPELEKYIKWHLTSSDGPWGYVANTVYHASEVHEVQHFVYLLMPENSREVLLGLYKDQELPGVLARFSNCEGVTLRVKTEESYRCHKPDLEAARSCAVWPDATLEQLRDESALKARLPALMQEFKAAMEELGFTY